MRILRIIKCIFIILLVVFTILLNWGQGYLAEQGIIYSDRLVLIKVVLTWLIVPFALVISIAFVVRLFYFALFEDNSLYHAYESGTLPHYEQINPFMYREVTHPAE